jgi:hypothetical protein
MRKIIRFAEEIGVGIAIAIGYSGTRYQVPGNVRESGAGCQVPGPASPVDLKEILTRNPNIRFPIPAAGFSRSKAFFPEGKKRTFFIHSDAVK